MQLSHLVSRHIKGWAATISLLALVAALFSTAQPAQAQLTLTPAGTALGFGLSTFASGFPSNSGGLGPIGIAFPTTGGVLVTDYPGHVRLFPTDTDGQNAANAPIGQFYGSAQAVGLAQVGSNIYMAQETNEDVVQINPDGTFNQTIVGDLGFAVGIVADPANGHLFVSDLTSDKIFDVDPIAKTAVPLVLGVDIDGLSISSDGKTLYGADVPDGSILGFNVSTGTRVFNSGFIPGGIDGTALGYGKLAGNIFANTNSGTFVEVNLKTDVQTLIADNGTRGDFVTVDPSNGSLLLTQTNSIVRLSGGDFSPVPEASTFVSTGLLIAGGLGLLLTARKRTRKI